MSRSEVIQEAQDKALTDLWANYTGEYFAPHLPGAFPDEFFWDDCFIAMGLVHNDPTLAKVLLENQTLLQHDSGKFANQRVDGSRPTSFVEKRNFGDGSKTGAPDGLHTSGISQPPMLAHATRVVGEELTNGRQEALLNTLFEPLVAYHSWLFSEREINGDGLVTQIHPYETGMDNTPPQETRVMSNRGIGARLLGSRALSPAVNPLVNSLRRDFKHAPHHHRMHNPAVIAYQMETARLRRHGYDMDNIVADPHIVLTEDLAYNAIFAEANQSLQTIADKLGRPLPGHIVEGTERQKAGLEALWSPEDQCYYSRDARTKELIPIETVASLLPLYAGTIDQDRANTLVNQLTDRFLTNNFIPSVPPDSPHFDRYRYWAGPDWEWITLLLIKGLEQYGHQQLAQQITDARLQAAADHGIGEYRDIYTGKPLGVQPFSGAAAVILHLAHKQMSPQP